jgi:hypothetical protein
MLGFTPVPPTRRMLALLPNDPVAGSSASETVGFIRNGLLRHFRQAHGITRPRTSPCPLQLTARALEVE